MNVPGGKGTLSGSFFTRIWIMSNANLAIDNQRGWYKIINERTFVLEKMINDTLSSKSDRASRLILDSAYTLFSSQGYAATSMRQIADLSGLALGGIYNHFSSKEDIFEAIILNRHPIFAILPHIKKMRGDSLDELVHGMAHGMVGELKLHPEFLNLMLTELVEFKGQHAEHLFEKIFPDILAITSQMAVYQDDLRQMPVPLILRAFVGTFFSYFVIDMLLNKFMPPEMQENALDISIDIFLNGIKKKHDLDSHETRIFFNSETP